MLFEVEGVSYRYDDGTPALTNISFRVDSGEHVSVLGANGSGKSTLLRLLAGLVFADAGTVRFDGAVLSEATLADAAMRTEFRRRVGFVFQNADAQLFNATVAEELAFGPRQLGLAESEVESRVEDILGFLGIHHLAGRPPFRMSGGEKRKVAIASVLTMNPDVLLFDEPFLGLDPRSQAWFVGTVQRLQAAGKTTLIATHTLERIGDVADKTIVLSEQHEMLAATSVDAGLKDTALLTAANLV